MSDILHSNHQAWLQHPVTQESMRLIDEKLKNVIDAIAAKSLEKDLPDSFIRHYGAQLKILKTIKKELYDSESFITASSGRSPSK